MENRISTIHYNNNNNNNNKILGTIITSGHYIGTYYRIGDRKQNSIDFKNNRRKRNTITKKQDRYIYEIIYTNPKMKITTEKVNNRKIAYTTHFMLINTIIGHRIEDNI